MVAVLPVLVALAAFSPVEAADCSADPWADLIVSSTTTTKVPENILGEPDGVLADFENDGPLPGFVIVSFDDDTITDGPGDDFAIHVKDFAASEFMEAFELSVSADGVLWVSLGVVQPTSPFQNDPETLTFDLQGSGLAMANLIRVTNTTVDQVNDREGVDLDAFEALNCGTVTQDDLMMCQDDLAECENDLLTCDRELDDALEDLDTCDGDLGTCEADLQASDLALDECLTALGDVAADLEEGQAGLDEIRRVIAEGPPPESGV